MMSFRERGNTSSFIGSPVGPPAGRHQRHGHTLLCCGLAFSDTNKSLYSQTPTGTSSHTLHLQQAILQYVSVFIG